MVRYQFDEDAGIHLVTADEPFHLQELYNLGIANLRRGGKPSELWRPSLFDFRRVDLGNINIAEFRRLLIRRKAFGAKYDNNPSAYLVRDMRSFAMVRLGTIFAELTHLRDESQTIITTDVAEVIDWLGKTLSLEESRFRALRKSIG